MFNFTLDIPQAEITKLNNQLDRFSARVRLVAIRAGTNAATRVFRKHLQAAASGNISDDNPPLMYDRTTGEYVNRPHLYESMTVKIWRKPDGSGYCGYAGPQSKKAPHAHLVEHGTKARYTKLGQYRGIMPAFHPFQRAYSGGLYEASNAFQHALLEKLNGYSVYDH